MKNPVSPKERNLVKGAIMRIFSRSELRRETINLSVIKGYKDPSRPRVTKWSLCRSCNIPTPTYLMDVDHVVPKISVDRSLEEMTWDELVDNTWCDISNLSPICRPCHRAKSKLENKERRRIRNGKQNQGVKRTGKTNRERASSRGLKPRAVQSLRKVSRR